MPEISTMNRHNYTGGYIRHHGAQGGFQR